MRFNLTIITDNVTLKSKLTLVILGRSGCGKGTQAERIMKRFGAHAFRFETGRFLRSMVDRYDNPTTARARKILKEGKLVPSWLPIYIWLNEFIEGGHAAEHLVFDGSPRTLFEAKIADEVMVWHDRQLPLCIYVDISAEEAAARLLLRGRADDTVSAIRNRMAYFSKMVMPVIRYYKKHNRFISINGEQAPEKVWADIDAALRARLGKQWPLR